MKLFKFYSSESSSKLGFGWALTDACPGPLFALIGARLHYN